MQAYNPIAQPQIKPFFTATLPLPPSVNDSYKIVYVYAKSTKPVYKGGRLAYPTNTTSRKVARLGETEKLTTFKQEAALTLGSRSTLDSNILNSIQSSKRNVSLSVHLIFYFPTMWKRDVDGGIKAAVDATFKYLGLNDNLVVCLSAEKRVDAGEPRVEVEVSCIAASGR